MIKLSNFFFVSNKNVPNRDVEESDDSFFSSSNLLGNYSDRKFQYQNFFKDFDFETKLKSYLDVNRKFAIFAAIQCLARKKTNLVIAEIGVCQGGNLEFMFKICKHLGVDSRILAFDTFEGHPHINSQHDNVLKHRVGKFALKNKVNTFEVLKNLDIEIYAGDILLTLERALPDGKVDFIHLDTDLFDSTKFVLERLDKLLSKGGICIVDDFNCETTPGIIAATSAVDLSRNFVTIPTPFNQIMLIKIEH